MVWRMESLIQLKWITAISTKATLPPLTSTYLMGALLWLSLVAFAVLGGADFGAGLLNLLAVGRSAQKVRGALIRAIGPIWEANEIWLIFLVTGLFTAFPIVFSTLSIALFVPAALALIGIVLRGSGFIYYAHYQSDASIRHGWGSVFNLSSVIAPFFFGVMAGTVASGHIVVRDGVTILDGLGYITVWFTPFPLACGLYAIAMCALLAAVYMVVEARNGGDAELIGLFRRRALYAYVATGLCGLLAGGLGAMDAPGIWGNLIGRALPLAIATAALGIALLILLIRGAYLLSRIAVGGVVAGIIITWGVAQFPYFIPPDLTLINTASPPSVMTPLLLSSVAGMIIILPSLWFLLYLFKARNRPAPHLSAQRYAKSLPLVSDASALISKSPKQEVTRHKQGLKPDISALTKIGAGTALLLSFLIVWWVIHRRKSRAGFS